MFVLCHERILGQAGLHQQQVYDKADNKGPDVVDGIDKCPECSLHTKVNKEREDESDYPGDNGSPVNAVVIMIPSILSSEESRDIHISFLADKVVGNEDRGNWSQDCAVGVHPVEECSAGTVDPPE